ncbi:MAG: glycosyltransferase family 2 protein [Sphingobacteriales bacterium]|nr:MAG: glycosyltransferase family 2 protein [Sphingobacteriales bacterium]
MNPLVSIIIPTFNYAHLITETLKSVLNQSYQHWECIIVDDGSTDNTEDIVGNFIKSCPKYPFKYVKKVNEGTSIAKNTGISLSVGKYIQFLDADDLISADKLTIQVSALESNNAALVFSKSVFFIDDDTGRNLINKYPKGFLAEQTLSDLELLRRIIKNNIITIGAPLVRKEVLFKAGLFKANLKNNEDWLLWFKVALLIKNFVYDGNDKSFTSIRIHNQSAMNSRSKMFDGEVVVRQHMEGELSEMVSSKNITQLRKFNADLLALHQIRSLKVSTGMKYILSSFVKNPVFEFNLFTKALFKLGVRVYKSAVS